MKNVLKKIFALNDDNKDTVWDLLEELHACPEVYSCLLPSYLPHFSDERLYCYSDGREVLVVYIDPLVLGDTKELISEVSECRLPPQYWSEEGSRTSPVWRISQLMEDERRRFRSMHRKANFHGLFISANGFFGVGAARGRWQKLGIKVLCEVEGAPDHPLSYGGKEDPAGFSDANYFIRILLSDAGEHEQNQDPFDALLREFVQSADNHDEDEDEGGDDAYENEEEDGDDDPSFDAFPDGEVEINDHTKIQLRILHPVKNPREELDRLEGCADIKARIDELIALSAFNRKMARLFPDGKPHAVSLHSVFLGNPGTGKTTVCKIFGSLLREAGVLSLGHVVVCDRGSFVGNLWGDEERAVEKIVEQAMGGVLMIDEAYMLNSGNERDPARLVLPQLMTVLADEQRRDIAVVLCGYKEPMLQLLETNPGLDSRFPNRFEFPDFTPGQLEQITRSRIDEYGYTFTRKAWEKYCRQLAEAWRLRDPRNWGNARTVANMLERIYVRHATRCMEQGLEAPEQLLQLTEDDIPAQELPRRQKRIGF